MKTKSLVLRIVLLSLVIVLAGGCHTKRAAEHDAVRTDLSILIKNWDTAQTKLKTNMASMKSQLEEFGKIKQDIGTRPASKNVKQNEKVKTLMDHAVSDLDTLENEIANLNVYIQEWNVKSKSLNELIKSFEDNKITPAEATERIASLRQFKALADPKMDHIDILISKYRMKHQKLAGAKQKGS